MELGMPGETIKQARNGKKILDAIGDHGIEKRDFALNFEKKWEEDSGRHQ
jgi:hypothetical protein